MMQLFFSLLKKQNRYSCHLFPSLKLTKWRSVFRNRNGVPIIVVRKRAGVFTLTKSFVCVSSFPPSHQKEAFAIPCFIALAFLIFVDFPVINIEQIRKGPKLRRLVLLINHNIFISLGYELLAMTDFMISHRGAWDFYFSIFQKLGKIRLFLNFTIRTKFF